MHLALGRQKVIAAEKLAEDLRKGQGDQSTVRRKIAEARAYVQELSGHVDRTAAAGNGVMDADWFKSWILKRAFLDPLERLEKVEH